MASITLNFEDGQIAPDLEPDIDDFGRTNVVTAARRNGGQATVSDDTGSLGTAAIGAYKTQVDINPDSDDALPQHAHFHLILGTDPDPRYPQVVVDLDANPDLVDGIANVDIGDVIGLEGIPADLGQPDALLLVNGYTEVIGSHRRTITFNTRPGAILTTVGFLDGDANACLQTAGAQLDAAITAEQVSFAVATTSGPIFTTSPPSGAQIIVNDREIMTVTSIAGGASPQTFVVTRDPDQRVAHDDASSVSVYRPLRLTL